MAAEFLDKVCKRKPHLVSLVDSLRDSVHGHMQLDALEIGLMIGYNLGTEDGAKSVTLGRSVLMTIAPVSAAGTNNGG
ncbi:MAG: hypothetical protein ABFD54_11175 [Armatimonadota bacterium]